MDFVRVNSLLLAGASRATLEQLKIASVVSAGCFVNFTFLRCNSRYRYATALAARVAAMTVPHALAPTSGKQGTNNINAGTLSTGATSSAEGLRGLLAWRAGVVA